MRFRGHLALVYAVSDFLRVGNTCLPFGIVNSFIVSCIIELVKELSLRR